MRFGKPVVGLIETGDGGGGVETLYSIDRSYYEFAGAASWPASRDSRSKPRYRGILEKWIKLDETRCSNRQATPR